MADRPLASDTCQTPTYKPDSWKSGGVAECATCGGTLYRRYGETQWRHPG